MKLLYFHIELLEAKFGKKKKKSFECLNKTN
jgi:hypothetical protein